MAPPVRYHNAPKMTDEEFQQWRARVAKECDFDQRQYNRYSAAFALDEEAQEEWQQKRRSVTQHQRDWQVTAITESIQPYDRPSQPRDKRRLETLPEALRAGYASAEQSDNSKALEGLVTGIGGNLRFEREENPPIKPHGSYLQAGVKQGERSKYRAYRPEYLQSNPEKSGDSMYRAYRPGQERR